MDDASAAPTPSGTLLDVRTDGDLPLVFSYGDALRHGLSRHQITRRVRAGRWHRWHRGVYSVTAALTPLPTHQRATAAILALSLARGASDAVSHLSAAVLHGWLLPMSGPGLPTVTSPSGTTCCRRRGGMVVQVASLPPSEVMLRTVQLDGAGPSLHDQVRCTRPARTLADLLRHLPVPDAIAIGDDVLRRGELGHEEVARALARQQDWPYAHRAAQALPLLDPRHESWLESFSFTTVHLAGLARPEPQVTVQDRDGRAVGRVDGWLDDGSVALEADGRAKYLAGLELAPAAAEEPDPGRVADAVAAHVRRSLLQQNERQRRLEALGVTVVRWSTHDILTRPQWVLSRVRQAQREGTSRRFTGTLTRQPAPPWRSP